MASPLSSKTLDLSGIQAELQRLGTSDEACRLVMGLLAQMADKNQHLTARLQAALNQLWRRKSEKLSPDQLALFLSKLTAETGELSDETASVVESPSGAADEAAEPPTPSSPGRAQRKRSFPAGLPRRTEEVRVPDDQRRCSCGREKVCIGYETQVVWEFEPASFLLIERKLEKLACKSCEENGVQTAPAPGKPIDGGRPGPGLLAQIVTAKEHDSQPLYRQSEIYKRHGIHLAPSTLGDWHAAAADLFEPVWRHLREDTLGSYLLSLDDTPMPVLDRDDPRGIKKGHLWTYIGDERRVAFCDFTPTWAGEHPKRVLADFRGRVIQADGYRGIDGTFQGRAPPVRAGCMDHCRRRFVRALDAGELRAAVVVASLRDLYLVEAEARDRKLDADERLRLRQEKSAPVMATLQRQIAELAATAPPKTALGKATTYAINQWSTLEAFLSDGQIPLSNAHVERQQRRTALGRKNYLFAGSDDGARRLATLQTVVVNCDLLQISMWHYLRDTFGRLADRWPQSRISELTPAAWAVAHKDAQQP